jgi:hypothetical protein
MPIFIIGQYKCGTSWLLSALSAHPQLLGIREIDVIRAVHRDGRPATKNERLRYVFGGNAWCRVPGPYHHVPAPDSSRPQEYLDIAPDQLQRLQTDLAALPPAAAVRAFLACVSAPFPSQRLVLKAADQIKVFDRLDQLYPDAPKIVITRDGRDASLSAQAFRRLMRESGAPWAGPELDFMQLLAGWADRARKAVKLARQGRVILVRYEDLSADFERFFCHLLERLTLDASAEIAAEINSRTSFEAQTGRPRGREAKDVRRKGAVGEWRTALHDDAKDAAWRVAGEVLQELGYTKSGVIRPLEISESASDNGRATTRSRWRRR